MKNTKNFSMPPETIRVLIVDDEVTILDLLKGRLERKGFKVSIASRGAEALDLAPRINPDVVVTDLRMPGLDGFAVLERIQKPTIIITGHGDKESAIRAVEAGAYAFFEKPFDLEALETAIRRAAERGRLEAERLELLKKLSRTCELQTRELESWDKKSRSDIIGECEQIEELRQLLHRLALKPLASLLILGESGTGKEVVARALHAQTHKNESRSPFIALNCAAVPPDLLESELFGHEKGAFSGAMQTKVGLAEAAEGGTLFLDEIGEMSPHHQAKILRLIQERSFRRVGGTKEIPFSARIVAATHRDLKKRIAENSFREDLFYRLSVVTCHLPPLRDRGADVMLLAEALAQKFHLKGLSPETLAELRSYPWPGNVRELANFIERAWILGLHDSEGYVTARILETSFGSKVTESPEAAKLGKLSSGDNFPGSQWDIEGKKLKELREEILLQLDRQAIEYALKKASGNISAAAKVLGLDRKNLARRMKELGLSVRNRESA